MFILYYKEHLPIIHRDDISNLKECLATEITVKNKRCFLTWLYRSPSQNCEQFQSFFDSLDILMNNINNLNPVISLEISMENVQNGVLLILVIILERNLIPLHQLRVIVKLLTSQPISQAIHLLPLTLFLHLILAK